MVAKYKINGKCGTGPLKSNSGTLCLLTMICQPRSMVRANLLNNSFGPVFTDDNGFLDTSSLPSRTSFTMPHLLHYS